MAKLGCKRPRITSGCSRSYVVSTDTDNRPWQPIRRVTADSMISRNRSSVACELIVDPAISDLETVLEGCLRPPTKPITDQRVVAAAAPYADGRTAFVITDQLDPGDCFQQADEPIDRNRAVRSDVERLRHLAGGKPKRGFNAIVNE